MLHQNHHPSRHPVCLWTEHAEYLAIELDHPGMRFDAADFLVGGASANTSLTIEGEGEIGVA